MHKKQHVSEISVSYSSNVSAVDAFLRLRLLLSDLTQEVESLAHQREESSFKLRFGTLDDRIDFYEEVTKFEIALIKRALHCTGGHQGHAAALLNLNSTTLNYKIKRFNLKQDW